MNEQLTIFDALSAIEEQKKVSLIDPISDQKLVSLIEPISDAKRQAIQRFLDRGVSGEPIACVNTYSPGRRQTEYFRLSYFFNGKTRHKHICGGSTSAKLAQHRAEKLQAMINRGAELAELLAAVEDYAGEGK